MSDSVLVKNLTIPQGTNYKHTFQYRDKAGAAINLTNYTARMQIRQAYTSAATLYNSETLGDFSFNAAAGDITLSIPGAVTTLWAFTSGVYDVELVDPSGEPIRIIQGKIKVTPEVTR